MEFTGGGPVRRRRVLNERLKATGYMLARLLQGLLSHLVVLAILAFALWGFLWRDALLGPALTLLESFGYPRPAPLPPAAVWSKEVTRPEAPPLDHPGPGPAYAFRPVDAGAVTERPSLDGLLQAARRAYWNDDLVGAEDNYRELLAHYPDAVDGYGELGNLLLAMGRTVEAREAFRQALVGLRAEGDDRAAARLERYLREAGNAE